MTLRVQEPCLHGLYLDAYREARRALAGRDTEALDALFRRADEIQGTSAFVVKMGIADAVQNLPMRARIHLCRLLHAGPCLDSGGTTALDEECLEPA
jgi:hypothetical protein